MILNNKTKIIATIGPATFGKRILREIIEAGVNVCRINFSHGTHENHKKIIKWIDELNKELSVHTAVLADLQGPKLRIGKVENNEVLLKKDKTIILTTDRCIGTAERIFVTYPEFAGDVKRGEKILIDDGKLVLSVTSTNKRDEVKAIVEQGGLLSSRKGVNLPDTAISASPLLLTF